MIRLRFSSKLLACPDCREPLFDDANGCTCPSCNVRYPIRDGIVRFAGTDSAHPVKEDSDGLIVTMKNMFKRIPHMYRLLVAVFGASSGGITPRAFMRNYVDADSVVLNLGSGSGERYGSAIHVDLFAFSGVDVVADISRLPFRNGSVDAVLSLGVLEHVPYPDAVVREIFRVLKPGGHAYFTTPFMQPYHSSPHDYRRWTLDGLRLSLQGFHEVRAGLRHGPTSATALQAANWFSAVFSFGSRRAFDVFLIFFTVLFMPFAHIPDLLLNRLRLSENMASGYFFIVRKP